MRRGLLTWDAEELPVAALEARLARLRAEMASNNLDAIVAYTNISRPAAVSWLSGFTPYWSEGLLYVPRDGEIAFATALSKRVAEWISTVMPSGEIIPTPAPGTAIGKRLSLAGARRIGMPDLDDVPARQAQALVAESPSLEIIDCTGLFDAVRSVVDDAERALVRKASQIAARCMMSADQASTTAQELIAPCEGEARKAAVEDIFVAVVPDLATGAQFQRTDTAQALGQSFALRMSLAYKAGWVRLTQSFARDPDLARQFAAARTAFESFVPGSTGIDANLRAAMAAAGADLKDWGLEQPRGSYPLVRVADASGAASTYNPAAPCVISIECNIGGHRWLAARPVV